MTDTPRDFIYEKLSPSARDGFDYFISLYRSLGRLPARGDLDPAKLKPCLPRTSLVDCSTREAPWIRLCGTELVAAFGVEVTGRDYLHHVPPARRAEAMAGYARCLDDGMPMVTRIEITSMTGRKAAFCFANLPLKSHAEADGADLVLAVGDDLGTIAYDDPVTAMPPEFSDVPVREYVDLRAA